MDNIRIDSTIYSRSFPLEEHINEAKKSSGNYKAPRSLEVTIKDFAQKMPRNDCSLSILSSILQSIDDSMSQIIKNMTLTPEEQKAFEEKQAMIQKLKKLAKEKKIDEQEALKELEQMLSDEDKKLLDEQYAGYQTLFA